MAVPESLLSCDWQVEGTQACREAGMFTQGLEEGSGIWTHKHRRKHIPGKVNSVR